MTKVTPFRSKLGARKSKGFTLIELSITIAAGIIFIALAAFGSLRALDNTRYSSLTRMIGSDTAGAITNLFGTNGTLTSLTANAAGKNILVGAGVKAETPWTTAWAVQTAGTANRVVIRYTIGGPQAATKGPSLATNLIVQYPIVQTAVYNAGNLDVTFNVNN